MIELRQLIKALKNKLTPEQEQELIEDSKKAHKDAEEYVDKLMIDIRNKSRYNNPT